MSPLAAAVDCDILPAATIEHEGLQPGQRGPLRQELDHGRRSIPSQFADHATPLMLQASDISPHVFFAPILAHHPWTMHVTARLGR